jgi:threonine dehydrogenase-like Zn-dependent dehydrogenase
MATMLQLQKLAGVGNVQMVEVDAPTTGPDEVLVKVKRSLISRGSELFGRYVVEQERPASVMGYSDAGDVVEVGDSVSGVGIGQAMSMLSPHAEYVAGSLGEDGVAHPLPEGMNYTMASFLPLASGAVAWTLIPPVEPGDTVVVLGQGLVGNLCAQAVRQRQPGRVIVVDALDLRCRIAKECGADEVLDLTGGKGADAVFECVGAAGGGKSFEQAMKMVKRDGVVHLIGLNQGGSYRLDSSDVMNKMVIGGYYKTICRIARLDLSAEMLMDGRINIEPLITHTLPGREADKAYHLLHDNPDEALGVVLDWEA